VHDPIQGRSSHAKPSVADLSALRNRACDHEAVSASRSTNLGAEEYGRGVVQYACELLNESSPTVHSKRRQLHSIVTFIARPHD
jgi:hypothetical protein